MSPSPPAPGLAGPDVDAASASGPVPVPAASARLRLALPKGRMQEGVSGLMAEAGLPIRLGARAYRPRVGPDGAFETKLLKPRGVVEMLAAGTRDVGFAGADWVEELGAGGDVVELLDTGLDRVRIVAAAPEGLDLEGPPPAEGPGRWRIATEYAGLVGRWAAVRGLDATIIRTSGATEVYPPEDADFIVDNTATGSTLAANGLTIRDELMASSTRLFAARAAMADPARAAAIERLVLVVRSVIEARGRVMIECNVPAGRLDAVVALLPCMDRPTVSPLHGGAGFAVKAAVQRRQLFDVVPQVKAAGGSDIVVSRPGQIIP